MDSQAPKSTQEIPDGSQIHHVHHVPGRLLMSSESAGTFPCQTWNSHAIPCGISELSVLLSWLVCLSPAFPRSLCSPPHLHLLHVPLPMLLLQPPFSPPTSDPSVHTQEVSSIFSCIPGQARTLTRRRSCDPRPHPTGPVAGPPQSTVGDGLGWLWFHGRAAGHQVLLLFHPLAYLFPVSLQSQMRHME